MVLDKYKDPFLGRMRKPEGLPPKFTREYDVVLGTNPKVVFEASLASRCCSSSAVLCSSLKGGKQPR